MWQKYEFNLPIHPSTVYASFHILACFNPFRCPHCQHYKPHYLELANELQSRSISQQITFHAVSCTLNLDVCQWYEVHGYPTVMGWGGSTEYQNITDVGIILNEYTPFDANSVAADMKFDIAEGGISATKFEKEYVYSNSTDQKEFDNWKENRIKEVIQDLKESYDFEQDINDRYHNAAVSLAYVLKTGVYTSKSRLTIAQKSALREFLGLVEWATPLHWNLRSTLVRELYHNFEFDAAGLGGKDDLIHIVERYQQNPLKTGNRREELLWGYIDESKSRSIDSFRRRSVVRGTLGAEHGIHLVDENIERKERTSWTTACTHDRPNSGFTCGLWELFHILTIGASQTENQMYGFSQGYIVSSKEVASILRNFVANFFHCVVCKNNFLKMYDECGHEHCTRLSSHVPFLEKAKDGGSDSSRELALWLWEVHNAGM